MMDLEKAAAEISKVVETMLGGRASPVLLARIRATLEDGMSDSEAFEKAVARVRTIVELFVGDDEASEVAERAQTIVDKVRGAGDS
jgi:hypothetical protein